MTDRLNLTDAAHGEGEDPAVTALLRQTYAAPAGDLYWKALEGRVLARLRESGPVAWWTVFSEWSAAGLAAAAVAMFAAGYALMQEQELMDNTRQFAAGAAMYTVFDSSSSGVAVALTVPARNSPRSEAPERYLNLIQP